MLIWGSICWQSTGPMNSQHRRINSQDYLDVISNPVLPMAMVQAMFPEGNTIFQDDNAPIHMARIVKEWHEEHSDFENLVWPPQFPNLDVIEQLQVRSQFQPHCL